MPRKYETVWPDCQVNHLVLSNERFIVFLDDALDVDWSTTLEYDSEGHRDIEKFNAVINEAALLEATPCEGISVTIKTHFKRLIGEAIARGLDHDYVGAQKMLRSAETYVLARSQETSRWWYVSASSLMTLPFIVAGGIFWMFRMSLILSLGQAPFWLSLCAVAGAIGACLSVIGRTGKQTFDCSAGRRLHFLEGASRIWAGAISGMLVGLAVWSGFILTILTSGNRMTAIMVLAAFAAGTGERLATSIITDITSQGVKSAKRNDMSETAQ